jgi:hypothetical protein
MKSKLILLPVCFALLLSGGCVVSSLADSPALSAQSVNCCYSRSKLVYLAVESSSPNAISLAKHKLLQIFRSSEPVQWVVVDAMEGQSTRSVLSRPLSTEAYQEVVSQFTIQQSSDRALVKAFKRMVYLAISNRDRYQFHGYIFTAGTTHPETLKLIQQLCQELARYKLSNSQIYIVGAAESSRKQMQKAIAPIMGSSRFLGKH